MKVYKQKINIIFLSMGLYILSLAFELNAFSYIAISWAYYILSVFIIRNNTSIDDPRILFPGFLLLYNSWYFIYLIIWVDQAILPHPRIYFDEKVLNISSELTFLSLIMSVSLINLFVKTCSTTSFSENNLVQYKKKIMLSEKIIINTTIIMLLIFLVWILTSGITSKRDYLENTSFLLGLFYYFSLIATYSVFIYAKRLGCFSLAALPREIIFLFFLLVIVALSAGERDLLARLVIGLIIIYSLKNTNNTLKILIIILSLSILIAPISQILKNLLISKDLTIFENFDFLKDVFLKSEFSSAGRNTYTLIYFGFDNSWRLLINDIYRALIPSYLIDSNISSSGAWFHNSFRSYNEISGTSGWGFGLIASGYASGGKLGIALVILIISFLLSTLFNLRNKSVYFYAFYLAAYLTAIYSIRADLANFLSQSFKVSLILILLIFLSHKLLKVKQ